MNEKINLNEGVKRTGDHINVIAMADGNHAVMTVNPIVEAHGFNKHGNSRTTATVSLDGRGTVQSADGADKANVEKVSQDVKIIKDPVINRGSQDKPTYDIPATTALARLYTTEGATLQPNVVQIGGKEVVNAKKDVDALVTSVSPRDIVLTSPKPTGNCIIVIPEDTSPMTRVEGKHTTNSEVVTSVEGQVQCSEKVKEVAVAMGTNIAGK